MHLPNKSNPLNLTFTVRSTMLKRSGSLPHRWMSLRSRLNMWMLMCWLRSKAKAKCMCVHLLSQSRRSKTSTTKRSILNHTAFPWLNTSRQPMLWPSRKQVKSLVIH
ncbi:phosphoribosylaminoimidazole carboxylase [Rhizopus delemar RA 99-880]|uniref:Phosphoribosylaminoimidazole carboxylase n=1 Tax=Rhizopus delemar (strain RA 99-880 / ATCC MYA-4621 / FGSC 9543 / NRRL 43880) TaxID=246409 RepID=I1BJ89_RHIO9|nr:phosphoribosylaminoimidazole carboxylase [Rhizopus delemar RA 99-880]|eukprot:EIE76269.1 phosphoribosylaminoimidazole carboxylase [Rhizopus delemar RA 99-880]